MPKTWAEKQQDGSYKLVSDFHPEPKLTDAERVADRLIGTCMESIESVCEDLGIDDPDSLAEELDGLMFVCDGCGWYCSVDELHDDTEQRLCEECAEDN